MTSPLRVAVADDEPVMQMYLEEVVAEFGLNVVATAGDGIELVRLFHTTQPDLIITDIKMPGMDGLEAVQEIYGERPVPVVFITGYSESHRIEMAENRFVLVYLVKPVGERELRKAIEEVLRRFGLFRALREEGVDMGQALLAQRRLQHAVEFLAAHHGSDFDEALNQLRVLARKGGHSLTDAALLVLESASPPDPS